MRLRVRIVRNVAVALVSSCAAMSALAQQPASLPAMCQNLAQKKGLEGQRTTDVVAQDTEVADLKKRLRDLESKVSSLEKK
jgi:TolA-binding protein